ncbi:MAG TPA: tetratricopeptide repeat protein [Verrucomicrobiae bacterium]|jgi:outer membrane protein assembly factor BamD (BamD/ComL family)
MRPPTFASAHPDSKIWSVLLLIFFAWYAWRCFANSDDRRVLLYKYAASVALILIIFVLMFLGLGFISIGFMVILAFVWLPSVVDMCIKPLTGLFDGGADETEPKPFYFIAAAKRMKGFHQEAAEEVRKQLEKFPGDFEGSLLLATIQAEDLHDLPGAQATIDELLEQATLTPQQIATALHTLADWQLQFGRDPQAARESLECIAQKFPDTQFSHAADQRIARLGETTATRDFRENAKFEVRQRERDIGLQQKTQPTPETFNADETAAEYVRQLEAHPADTITREKLAILYAEHFQRLDLAVDQLEQLIELPDETTKHVARWLNLLATLQINIGRDENAARNTLQRIIQRFPKSSHAELATMRLATLRNEFKANAATATKTLGTYEKNLGLKRA